MQAIGYYIALPFLYLLSILPPFLFYGFSDFIYFLMYYVFGYRKKVVMNNLRNSFPGKSEAELKAISKKFYQYLCDLSLETFQTLTMSREYSQRHIYFNPSAKSLFDNYHAQGKSIIIVMGHYGNWEWAGNACGLNLHQKLYVVYHPLTNPHWNNLIVNMRMRFGTGLITMRDTYKGMIRNKPDITATAFIADQTPSPENAYWTTFLHQDTPVFRGTEMIARKMNYPIVFAKIKRVKRGYYEIFAETLFEEPSKTSDGEISEAHTRKLEQDIIAQPEIWLWSHRRWKHKRPA